MSAAPKILAAALALLPLSSSHGDPEEIDFASLSDFDYVEGMTLPSHVTQHNRKTIKVSGFMAREDSGSGPTEYFMLINDACGCNGTPFLNEVVFCAMPAGEPTEMKPGTVTVTGQFFVGEERDNGVVLSLYRMDVTDIEE